MTLPAMTNVSRLLFLFASLLIVTAPAVQAQTPSATVTNESGDVVFQSNADGGLLAPGELGTGTIPTEGAGTRLMWYPAKAAFRAGAVENTPPADGTQWNADNVGDHSVAFGLDTKASGDGSTAMGISTQASGRASTAMGGATKAATDGSLSMGEYNSSNFSDDGTLFVVGNGSFADRSDALVVDQSGNLTISGTLTENSDRRLKTKIQPLGSGVLAPLSEIEPVRFQFKDERTHPSGPHIGLIAQQVQAQFPALVSEGASGHLSVSYSKLTAVLLKGLQEQQARIDSLSRTVRSLQKDRSIQEVKQGQKHLAEQVAALQQTSNARSPILPAGWSRAALLVLLVGAGSFAAGRRWEGTAS
jgi:hypothetical protein